ncbi:MAG TPA: N-acetylglucosamine-6-phosphate deacetylase, partial [Candidatus Limnocylindrales bacterium]|nr:N-acetylglucosamine-6-phosphate deacetylase [Candidatus Limnocylindrales bacterium]
LHIHGANGFDTMDANEEAIHGMGRFLVRHGVTAYLPTTVTASLEDTQAAIANVRACPQPDDGAQHLGIHLEGPYLNPNFKGAQSLEFLRLPDPKDYSLWLTDGTVRLITLAPELDGALELIDAGVKAGIEFAVGHSGANYGQVTTAAERGLRQASHLFNGMIELHHRFPGVVGAVLMDQRITPQLIVDGVHLHQVIVDMVQKLKGATNTILITDAIRAVGLVDGEYTLGDQKVYVQNGIARTENGNLAGSTLTMIRALKNVIAFTGISLPKAITMASTAPAYALGLRGKKGVLLEGADADLIFLNQDFDVCLTMVGGKVVFKKEPQADKN